MTKLNTILSSCNMKPIVGILCSTEEIQIPGWGKLSHQVVFQKYIDALVNFANCVPVLIPNAASYEDLIRNLNGILLPGGVSNVAVELYSDATEHVGQRDPIRDRSALALIRAAEVTATPLLGICRGMQEINVAFGGSLITAVHERVGRFNHRSNPNLDLEQRFAPSHILNITDNSWLKKVLSSTNNSKHDFLVNSLHGQGVESLGKDLMIDAYCEDQTIEAISHTKPGLDIFGVQWHPEWNAERCEISMLVWQKFGDSCRKNVLNKARDVSIVYS